MVVVQHVTDHDQVVGVAVVVVQTAGFLDVDQFGRVDDVNELEPVVSTHPERVGLGAGHKPRDAVGVQHAAGGPQVLPCSVGQIPSCHTDAVQADVGHVVDHGDRRVVSSLSFPGVDHGEGAAGDDANAAERATEDVGAVVAKGIGRPVGHAVVHRQALVDVQSTRGVQLPAANAEVGGGVQVGAKIHEFEVLAGSLVPVAPSRNAVGAASVPQNGARLGADGEFCRAADVGHLDAKHVVAREGAAGAVSVSVEQRFEEFT